MTQAEASSLPHLFWWKHILIQCRHKGHSFTLLLHATVRLKQSCLEAFWSKTNGPNRCDLSRDAINDNKITTQLKANCNWVVCGVCQLQRGPMVALSLTQRLQAGGLFSERFVWSATLFKVRVVRCPGSFYCQYCSAFCFSLLKKYHTYRTTETYICSLVPSMVFSLIQEIQREFTP